MWLAGALILFAGIGLAVAFFATEEVPPPPTNPKKTVAAGSTPKQSSEVAKVVVAAPAPLAQASVSACEGGRSVRLIVDNSGSMRGFFAETIAISGLRSLISRMLNVAGDASRAPGGGRLRDEVLFVGGTSAVPRAEAANDTTCRSNADCSSHGTVCCDAPDAHDDAPTLRCRSRQSCGAIVGGTGNEWSSPQTYAATSSRVSRGFQLLFDPCVETAVFITDGLETPDNVERTPCGKNERPPFRDPGLLPLLKKYVDTAGSDWGVWTIRALLPFNGKVYLECGFADPEMTQALGGRLNGGHGKSEVWYGTKGTELQPIILLVVSRGGQAAVKKIAEGLEKRVSEYLADTANARAGGAKEAQPVVDVVQVWPAAPHQECAKVTADAWREDDGTVRKEIGELQPSHGFVTMHVVGQATEQNPKLAHVFRYAAPGMELAVDGRTAAESERFVARMPAPGGVPSRKGKAAMVAGQLAQTRRECRDRAGAMLAVPMVGIPANPGPKWQSDVLLDVGCISTYSTLDLKTQQLSRPAGLPTESAKIAHDRLAGFVDVAAVLSCKAEIDPAALARLDLLAGNRFVEPEASRGIPGMDKLVAELRTWVAGLSAGSIKSQVASVKIHRN